MEPLQRELRSFVQAVESGGRPVVSGEDGVRALKMALGLLQSAGTGSAVAPMDGESCVSHGEAAEVGAALAGTPA